MKFFKIFSLFVFFISSKTFATGQVPDYLIIEKDTLFIQSNPLEEYFKDHPIPDNLITNLSSANWRGYVAYFKFVGGKLVVENVYKEDFKENDNGKIDYFLTSIYKDIFGTKANFQCDFYSGLLICPSGNIIEYVHMGYSSLYENYNLIEIKKGVNYNSKKFSAEEFQKFKIDYFNFFKRTEDYKNRVKILKEMEIESDFSNGSFLIENPGIGRVNQSLKKKEAEFKADKQIESFMFVYLSDYMKTIEIPNK
jgi:hypothetical protein